jgi:UDP-glucose 4-epimerase
MATKRSRGKRPRSAGRVVAVTGTSEQLGAGLIGLMESDPAYERILAVDVRDPTRLGPKTSYHYVDLTVPAAGKELAELFEAQGVDTVVHLAFLSNPAHDPVYAHELQVAGSMHVLNAVGAARVPKVVLLGSVMSYGARPDNPNYLTEQSALRGTRGNAFITDLIDVENQLERFAQRHGQTVCTMLRMGARLGGKVDSFVSRLLARPVVPTLMGCDPLMQLVHETDALAALKTAVDADHRGAFNIVGEGVLPLSSILRLAGRLALPIPHFLGERLGGFLWAAQAITVPPEFLDYLRYLWVADGTRARREMGLRFRYTTRETLLDFVRQEQQRQTAADDLVRSRT